MKSSSIVNQLDSTLISERAYNFIIGIVLVYGFAINWWIVANIPVTAIQAYPMWAFLVAYFVSCIAGSIMFNASSNPVVSFLGYNLVVVPFGFVLNLVLSKYNTDLIVSAMQVTTIVTVAMMFMGMTFPAFFRSIGTALIIGTVVAIVVELGLMFFTGNSPSIMDWIVAIIFCGWIGFDWATASSMPKTVDNAIDGAANLYMSIINLFVRILSIMGDD